MQVHDALVETLAREVEPASLLDRAGRILFVNDAWDRTARMLDAPEAVFAERWVGRSWLDGVHGRFRRFYRALLGRAFSLTRAPEPIALLHLSEGNSPEHHRTVAHRFIPLYPEDSVQSAWLLVVHTAVSEALIDSRYRVEDPKGLIQAACGCCRRVRRKDGEWVFSPAYLERGRLPTDGWALCAECRHRYYARQQVETLRRLRAQKIPKSAGLWLQASGEGSRINSTWEF